MGHDQLFKEILRTFLREFLKLFFPDAAARLDFDSLRFPNKELFKGFPDGRPREPDLVAEVQGRDGKPRLEASRWIASRGRATSMSFRRGVVMGFFAWLLYDFRNASWPEPYRPLQKRAIGSYGSPICPRYGSFERSPRPRPVARHRFKLSAPSSPQGATSSRTPGHQRPKDVL